MEIDLAQARAAVKELADEPEVLDGTEWLERPSRVARRLNSRTSRTLLCLPHLGDHVSVEIMGVCHDFKPGDNPPQGSDH
ncbi:hypothetical protein ACFFS2_30770 [Streptomyces aurantiacus]|uniref:Uncharacterized protein n=1 Tax=Streptomyces aurantiacus TaxID=47760 RepID=A0A7G1P3U3_9ACTN|nr:hypothetical protein [Streptomyces aurantiacus]BCL28510.1 hypothetical protein GCM10017557_33690 [Streptomyces aurantiacus]